MNNKLFEPLIFQRHPTSDSKVRFYFLGKFVALLLIAHYPATAWAGDGDLGPLIIGIFFGLIGLGAGLAITLLLPVRKLVKALALIPMMALGCAIGFGLSIIAMELLKTPEQKAQIESQNGLPGLFKFSCNSDDLALTQYLQKMSEEMRHNGNILIKALNVTQSHEGCMSGVGNAKSKTLEFKASTFLILAQELYRVSPKNEFCNYLRELHTWHATPLLRILHESNLPIACSNSEEPAWASGLKSWVTYGDEDVWTYVMFLKEAGVEFKNVPANIETFISRVVWHGEPRLIRFALEQGSDPLGYTGKKWPSGEFPKAAEIWRERQNLPRDNPHGYSPLSKYTSAANVADIDYINSKLAEATK